MRDWKRHFKMASLEGKAEFGADYTQGSSGDVVKVIQGALNMNGASLTVDGVFGPATRQAVIDYQTQTGLTPDGIVGPATAQALGVNLQPLVTEIPPSTPKVPITGRNATVVQVPGIERLSANDLKAMYDAAQWIGVNVDWLATAMSFESGLNPAAVNAQSGATGLIQFMPSTAAAMGTSTTALKSMSFVQQLEYVKRYFASYRGQLHSLEDVYLAIFYPAEIGKSTSNVIASAGNPVYDQNAGFDRTQKGFITVGDVTATIRAHLDSAIALGKRVIIPGVIVGLSVLSWTFILSAFGLGGYWIAKDKGWL
jgi:peptidoglycan hydrolase-like protein with peptidoglycan-binding domain